MKGYWYTKVIIIICLGLMYYYLSTIADVAANPKEHLKRNNS